MQWRTIVLLLCCVTVAVESIKVLRSSLSSASISERTTDHLVRKTIADVQLSGSKEAMPVESKQMLEERSISAKDNSRLSITPTVLKLGFYYFLLYLFTVIFNVSNKRVLNVLPLPATMAAIQLILGIPLFMPLWIIKPPRGLNQLPKVPLITASISHALGNLATIYSLGAGAVSFTHVVKSAEPVFAAVLAGILNRNYYAPQVYLSLIPIVFGVALASCTELTFTWFGFITAMVSNFFYQLRIVVSKPLIVTHADGSKLSGGNLFRLLTIIAAVFLTPIALCLEGNSILPAWSAAASSRGAANAIMIDIIISGFSFYMYNEVSFWILDLVQPVTHAVGNTIKRVVLIVAAVLVFRAPVTMEGAIGSAIAIGGSLLYALAVQKYHPQSK